MKFVPMNKHLLVSLDAEEEKIGALYVPKSAKSAELRTGIVLATGRGQRLQSGAIDEPQAAIGDRVLLHSFSGTDIEVDDIAYRLINEDDVLGILRADA